MVRLLIETGFEIEGLVEVQVPIDADDALSLHDCRMGAPLALRRSVEGPQARVQSRCDQQPFDARRREGAPCPTTTKFLLTEDDLAKDWYNIAADLPLPGRRRCILARCQPIGPDDLAPLFPMEVIKQEVSQERWIRSRTRSGTSTASGGRPRSIARTGSKRRSSLPDGSHLLQVRGRQPLRQPQAEYRRPASLLQQAGRRQADRHRNRRRPMGQLARPRLPDVRSRAQGLHGQDLLRAEAVSPGADGDLGRDLCPLPQPGYAMPAARSSPQDPESTGSLGIAISEAVEDAATRDDTKYALGSVLNHVLMHQTVIGLEALKQLEMADAWPDVVIGCTGGGSNFGASSCHSSSTSWTARRSDRRRGTGCLPVADQGRLRIRFRRYVEADTAGQDAHARPWLYSGGDSCRRPSLSRHGAAGQPPARARPDRGAGGQADRRVRVGGPVRADRGHPPGAGADPCDPAAVEEALAAKESGETKTILFGLSGHGHFDLAAYDSYLSGSMQDLEYPAEAVEAAMADLPAVPVS